VQQSEIERCQQIIGYRFSDPDMLKLALTHASVANCRLESNERLEFLGDAVLAVVVCQELYESHGDLLEGQMTKIKSAVVSRQTCAMIAEDTGISDLLFLGKGIATPDKLPQSVSAAVFESIIGAIYLDGGLAPARQFILEHTRPYIQSTIMEGHQRNYKSLLQQHAQRQWSTTPDYRVLDEKGPEHSKAFEVAVSVNGRHFPSAWGASKKEAEQEAARRALAELGVLDEQQAEG